MGKLIDADEIIAALTVDPYDCIGCPEPEFMQDIVNLLREAQAEDAEIVIRCKECKYWQKEHLCNHWSRYGTIETGAYDYCSNGRKKC